MTITWTLFSRASRRPSVALPVDAATWAWGAAVALWKALITHAGDLKINPVAAAKARRVIGDVLAEHEQSS